MKNREINMDTRQDFEESLRQLQKKDRIEARRKWWRRLLCFYQ